MNAGYIMQRLRIFIPSLMMEAAMYVIWEYQIIHRMRFFDLGATLVDESKRPDHIVDNIDEILDLF